ncbi:Fungal transcriptional regulatory protein, N-terminal [Penicillium digitatum]|nr:Fungal transcriptional regulatory protein, N-terminal [Penicillium digitatum]
MSGLDQAQRNSTISMARSMRVAKQERSLVVERDEKPRKQRKRALVACNRCRKRKIKCNGDLNTGLACSSCRSVGATECQYIRVNSLAPEDAAREAARLYATKSQGRSILMGSPQMRAPYQRDEYELEIQSNFSRHPVGMDHSYDDQSANYHGQTSPGYMMSSNLGAVLDYGTAWGNRAWDLTGRTTNGEFFEEHSNLNQAAYSFVLPGQGMSAGMPQSTGAMTTYTDAVDRTLPTPPTCRSQPQSNITLSTLPDGLSGMTLAADPKGWNSRYATIPDGRPVVMPAVPSNGLYNISPSSRIKSNDLEDGTSDLVFGYIPMSTSEDPSPLPAASSSSSMASSATNPLYPALDPIENTLVGEYHTANARLGRTFLRDTNAGQRLLALTSDCAPDVYSHAGNERRKSRGVVESEVRCSTPTLVNGLPYTRVRHVDSTVALPYGFLADGLSDYGRSVDHLHRSPVSPLGHQGAY